MIYQKGVGLIEVLVAVLLLGIGILGYSALQASSNMATSESVKRAQAMVIMQGLAERMRLNDTVNYVGISDTAGCTTSTCTPAAQAKADLYQAKQLALKQGMELNVVECPRVSNRQTRSCILAAWNDTRAVSGTAVNTCLNNSGNSQGGSYNNSTDCLMLEAY